MFIALLLQIILLHIFMYLSTLEVQEFPESLYLRVELVSHGKFVMLVIHCCIKMLSYITNHELSNIKLHTFIISHSFLNQESQYSLVGSLASRVFHKAAIKMLARVEVPLDCSTGEEYVSKFVCFWVRFNSLYAIWPMASLPCCQSTLSCLLCELQHTLSIFYWNMSQVLPTPQGEGSYTKMYIPGGRDHWKPP